MGLREEVEKSIGNRGNRTNHRRWRVNPTGGISLSARIPGANRKGSEFFDAKVEPVQLQGQTYHKLTVFGSPSKVTHLKSQEEAIALAEQEYEKKLRQQQS